MQMNVALRKKLSRDLGLNITEEGAHIRKNLKEIILFEVLLEESGWLDNPRQSRETFVTLDEKEELSADVVDFWRLCGQNRDVGIKQLAERKVVSFKDITVMKKDSDEIVKELKTMIKELPEMIKKVPDENSLKSLLLDHF